MEFLKKIQEFVVNCEFEEITKELANAENADKIKSCDLDLIHLLGNEYLCDEQKPRCLISDAIGCCEQSFRLISQQGNPKELLVAFLEIIENVRQDVRFQIMLPLIQNVLLRMVPDDKQMDNLTWVLQHLQFLVEKLPLPPNYGLEDAEKQLLEVENNVEAISSNIQELVYFLQPFINKISLWKPGNENGDKFQATRKLVINFITSLFEIPLVYVDLSDSDSCLHKTAAQLVKYLCQLEHNLLNFVLNSDLPKMATASLFYLIHAKGVCRQQLFCVYSNRFILQSSVSLSVSLLKHSHEFAIQKGLALLEFVSSLVSEMELQTESLEMEEFVNVLQLLIGIMVGNSVLAFRKLSVQVLIRLMNLYDRIGRYKLFVMLMNCSDHSGVKDLLISEFKKNLIQVLADGRDLNFYTGLHLEKVLKLMTDLPKGAETDVIDERERLLAALNFLIFLLKRDGPNVNVTGVWDLVKDIQMKFLDPLQKALELSNAHFSAELTHQRSEESGLSVSMQGLPLAPVPPEQRIKTIERMLTCLDLIQSVLSYVTQIINTK